MIISWVLAVVLSLDPLVLQIIGKFPTEVKCTDLVAQIHNEQPDTPAMCFAIVEDSI